MSIKSTTRFLGVLSKYRNYSTDKPLVGVSINDKNGVATVTLQKPPVNSLNLDLLKALHGALQSLEKDRARGLILTSSAKSVFSAGLDILEMYRPNLERATEFWTTLQNTWIALYGSSYPTVAVINGHSPAGGCLLALSCEYRVMSKDYTIGLNETQLGMTAPFWFASSMRNVIGTRQTELALTTGRLFKTSEAKAIGLVDEIVDDKDDGLEAAERFLKHFAKMSPLARTITKNTMRNATIQELITQRESDLKTFIGSVTHEKVQKGLEVYLEALKKKQKS